MRRVALVSRLGLLRLRGTGGFLVALLVDALGTETFTPISMLYVHVVARLPLPAIAVVLTIAMVLTLPLTPLTGALVDRFGARRLVIASHLLQAMGFLGCHFARKTSKVTPGLSHRRDHPPPCWSLPYSLPPACACSTPRRRRSSPTSRLSSQRAGPLVWIGRRDTERGSGCGRPACRPRRRRERDWRLPRLDPDIGPGLFTVLYAMGPALPWLVLAALVLAAGMLVAWLEPRLPAPAVRAR